MRTVKGQGYGKKLPLAPKGFIEGLWFKFKRFCLWVWRQLHDGLNLAIFIIVFAVLSSEVWLCYVLGFIFKIDALIHVANICWIFWLGPFTPFLPLVIAITLGVRRIIDLIFKNRVIKKKSEK